MIHHVDRSTRVLTVTLALWLVGLNASVHFLHVHPACRAATTGYSSTVVDSPDGPNARPASGFSGLCPACLFLAKYVAEGRSEPPEPTADDHATESSQPVAPAGPVALLWPTTTPRAPPL